MVGMATRANNNHINGSGLRNKGKHEQSEVTVLRKLSMNGDKRYTGVAGKILDQ